MEKGGRFMIKKIMGVTLILIFMIQVMSFADNQDLTIGIYQNPPLVGLSNNKPTGLFVELMNHIADLEGWNITYEMAYLNENFDKVEALDLDIMLAVAYTDERAERFTYSAETIYTNWGHVYTNERQNINSFSDLEGKTIGVEKGDVHYVGINGIKNTLEAFGIHAYFVEYDGRVEMIADLEDKKIEAAVVSRLFGEYYEADHEIVLTAIQFNPIELKLITCKEDVLPIMDIIDERLIAFKAEKKLLVL